jgi:hypothetical protein
MNDSTTQAAVSTAERKLTEDEISELRQQAGELYEQAARQDRRAKRLRHLEEGRARLDALSAELVAAGRCGRLSERDRDSDDDYAFASVCVLAAGHDGDCDDSSALVPAPGAPSADEAEREAPDPEGVWSWSRWRRRRQYQARLCHYRQRGYAFS